MLCHSERALGLGHETDAFDFVSGPGRHGGMRRCMTYFLVHITCCTDQLYILPCIVYRYYYIGTTLFMASRVRRVVGRKRRSLALRLVPIADIMLLMTQ